MAWSNENEFISFLSVTSMFNVDVDRSVNAPPLKSTVYIGIVLWEQQLYYMYIQKM